jgi:hypothetical protein
MATWDLYYDGVPIAKGISDTAKESIKSELDETLRSGGVGWFTIGSAVDPGAATFYLHPGVGVAFTSDEARVEPTEPGSGTPTVIHF